MPVIMACSPLFAAYVYISLFMGLRLSWVMYVPILFLTLATPLISGAVIGLVVADEVGKSWLTLFSRTHRLSCYSCWLNFFGARGFLSVCG